jgi:hypothetical protein
MIFSLPSLTIDFEFNHGGELVRNEFFGMYRPSFPTTTKR